MIFYLRSLSKTDTATLWEHARLLGTPPGVVKAILNGEMHTLHAELEQSGGWPTLVSLLAYGGGLDADLDVLAVAQDEYEEVALGEQRLRMSVTTNDLYRRGYRVRQQTHISVEELTDPKNINTFPELVRALKLLRLSQGKKAYRKMAKKSHKLLPGWDPAEHESRSHTGLRHVIRADATPKLPAVLAFIRGCGITNPRVGREWAAAHARATVHLELTRSRPPTHPKNTVDEDWSSRSPSGPNPSMA